MSRVHFSWDTPTSWASLIIRSLLLSDNSFNLSFASAMSDSIVFTDGGMELNGPTYNAGVVALGLCGPGVATCKADRMMNIIPREGFPEFDIDKEIYMTAADETRKNTSQMAEYHALFLILKLVDRTFQHGKIIIVTDSRNTISIFERAKDMLGDDKKRYKLDDFINIHPIDYNYRTYFGLTCFLYYKLFTSVEMIKVKSVKTQHQIGVKGNSISKMQSFSIMTYSYFLYHFLTTAYTWSYILYEPGDNEYILNMMSDINSAYMLGRTITGVERSEQEKMDIVNRIMALRFGGMTIENYYATEINRRNNVELWKLFTELGNYLADKICKFALLNGGSGKNDHIIASETHDVLHAESESPTFD